MNDIRNRLILVCFLCVGLAPLGAVVKSAGVDPEIMQHTGPAVIFESESEAMAGILGGKVKEGDVLPIPKEGNWWKPKAVN